jgi:hypothetical protein
MSKATADAAYRRVQGQSDDDLLVDLGRSLALEEGLGAFTSADELRQTAGRWLAERQVELAAALCANPMVRSISRAGKTDDRELFIVAFDALAAVFITKLPVPMGTLTALLLRKGFLALCGPGWPPDEPAAPGR